MPVFYKTSPDIIYICCSMKLSVHCKIKQSKCDEYSNILSVSNEPNLYLLTTFVREVSERMSSGLTFHQHTYGDRTLV